LFPERLTEIISDPPNWPAAGPGSKTKYLIAMSVRDVGPPSAHRRQRHDNQDRHREQDEHQAQGPGEKDHGIAFSHLQRPPQVLLDHRAEHEAQHQGNRAELEDSPEDTQDAEHGRQIDVERESVGTVDPDGAEDHKSINA
jgi:hypothetical protein